MARVVVTGAGVVGLTTAMLLSRDGHDVVVLERDAAEPDGDHDALWSSWARRGVNQFRGTRRRVRLKDVATWHRTIAAFPLAAHWAEGEPIDGGVAVMAGIEDRHRDPCPARPAAHRRAPAGKRRGVRHPRGRRAGDRAGCRLA